MGGGREGKVENDQARLIVVVFRERPPTRSLLSTAHTASCREVSIFYFIFSFPFTHSLSLSLSRQVKSAICILEYGYLLLSRGGVKARGSRYFNWIAVLQTAMLNDSHKRLKIVNLLGPVMMASVLAVEAC